MAPPESAESLAVGKTTGVEEWAPRHTGHMQLTDFGCDKVMWLLHRTMSYSQEYDLFDWDILNDHCLEDSTVR
jgi:hypothetical protein